MREDAVFGPLGMVNTIMNISRMHFFFFRGFRAFVQPLRHLPVVDFEKNFSWTLFSNFSELLE